MKYNQDILKSQGLEKILRQHIEKLPKEKAEFLTKELEENTEFKNYFIQEIDFACSVWVEILLGLEEDIEKSIQAMTLSNQGNHWVDGFKAEYVAQFTSPEVLESLAADSIKSVKKWKKDAKRLKMIFDKVGEKCRLEAQTPVPSISAQALQPIVIKI